MLDFINNEKDIKKIFLTIYTSIDRRSPDKILIDLNIPITEDSIFKKTFNNVVKVEKLLMLIIKKARTKIGKKNLL